MKIIACIKQVPDSEAKVKAEGGQVSWGDAPLVINPFDEYAVEGDSVTVDRITEEGRQTVSAKMPAVLSLVQSIGEPRYPSFMGIRKASKATIPVWSLADVGASAPAPVVTRTELMNPPVQEREVEMITGESAAEIADKLADKILAEKVL